MLSAQTIQIGYSEYGPHIIWAASFSAERKDALIKKISITAKHKKGEQRSFIWDHVKETFFQLQAGSDIGEFAKPSEVLALKVSVLTLTERLIIFKDAEVQKDLRDKLAQVIDYYKYSQNQEQNSEALMKAKELVQAQEFFADNMYWKEGDYTFEVEMQVLGRAPHRQKFTVTFRRGDIERLQSNIPLFQSHLRAITVGNQERTAWNYVRLPINPVD